MHPAAVGEGFAVDPAENVAAVLVDAEPPRRGVEAGAFQMQENVAHQPCAAMRRLPDGVTGTDDVIRRGTARE
jgi:hypothetical protein